MDYTTIKVPVKTHKLIKDLCSRTQMPQQELIYNSLQDYQQKLFWEECNSAYTRLNGKESEDQQLYDNTLLDGLDDEY